MSQSQLLAYRNGKKKTSIKGRIINRVIKSWVELESESEKLTFNSIKECADYFRLSQGVVYQNFKFNQKLKKKYKVTIHKP